MYFSPSFAEALAAVDCTCRLHRPVVDGLPFSASGRHLEKLRIFNLFGVQLIVAEAVGGGRQVR